MEVSSATSNFLLSQEQVLDFGYIFPPVPIKTTDSSVVTPSYQGLYERQEQDPSLCTLSDNSQVYANQACKPVVCDNSFADKFIRNRFADSSLVVQVQSATAISNANVIEFTKETNRDTSKGSDVLPSGEKNTHCHNVNFLLYSNAEQEQRFYRKIIDSSSGKNLLQDVRVFGTNSDNYSKSPTVEGLANSYPYFVDHAQQNSANIVPHSPTVPLNQPFLLKSHENVNNKNIVLSAHDVRNGQNDSQALVAADTLLSRVSKREERANLVQQDENALQPHKNTQNGNLCTSDAHTKTVLIKTQSDNFIQEQLQLDKLNVTNSATNAVFDSISELAKVQNTEEKVILHDNPILLNFDKIVMECDGLMSDHSSSNFRKQILETSRTCNLCIRKYESGQSSNVIQVEESTLEERLAQRDALMPMRQLRRRASKVTRFVCSTCGRNLLTRAKLVRHSTACLTRHKHSEHPVPNSKFVCRKCGIECSTLLQLKDHVYFVHDKSRPLSCPLCTRRFYRMHDLKIHLNIHLKIKSYVCDVCGRQFNHLSNLKRHQRVHSGIRPYVCETCGQRFNQIVYLKLHMKRHGFNSVADKSICKSRKSYCHVCGKTFLLRRDRDFHEVTEHSQGILECKSCCSTFETIALLKSHPCSFVENTLRKSLRKRKKFKKLMPVNPNALRSSVSETDAQSGITLITGGFLDSIPEIVTYNAKNLPDISENYSNLKLESNKRNRTDLVKTQFVKSNDLHWLLPYQKSPDCNSKLIEVNIKIIPENVEVNSNETIECVCLNEEDKICVLNITENDSFNAIKNNKTFSFNSSNNRFANSKCIDKFPGGLSLHETCKPTNIFSCHRNSSQSGTDTSCRRNVLSKNGEKLEALEEQTKSNSSVSTRNNGILRLKVDGILSKHVQKYKQKNDVRSCQEFEPIECPECSKVFNRRWNFRQHYSTHFPELNQYHCNQCGKRFAYSTTYKAHISTHAKDKEASQSVSCPQCDKVLGNTGSLRAHVRRCHLKIQPYSCQLCNKTFCVKSELEYHLRVHRGEQPYVCFACGRAFSHVSHLHRHERLHTGERPYQCQLCSKSFIQVSCLYRHMDKHHGEKEKIFVKKAVKTQDTTNHSVFGDFQNSGSQKLNKF